MKKIFIILLTFLSTLAYADDINFKIRYCIPIGPQSGPLLLPFDYSIEYLYTPNFETEIGVGLELSMGNIFIVPSGSVGVYGHVAYKGFVFQPTLAYFSVLDSGTKDMTNWLFIPKLGYDLYPIFFRIGPAFQSNKINFGREALLPYFELFDMQFQLNLGKYEPDKPDFGFVNSPFAELFEEIK